MRHIKRRLSFLFVSFLTLAAFTLFSCERDLSDDLDEDFSTSYSYYPEESSGSSVVVVKRYSIGDVISDLPTVASPEFFSMKPGYKILGWKFLKNVFSGSTECPSNVKRNDDETISEITVTSAPLAFFVSEWKPITYSVVFYGNGGVSASGETETAQTLTYDANVTLDANPFSLENYDFAGWGTNASQSPNYPPYRDLQPVGKQTGINFANREGSVCPLYALWIRSDVTISFDSNANDGVGGVLSGSMSSQTLSFRNLPTNLTSNAFTREGHTFAGWNTASTGSGTYFYDGELITQANYPLGDTTLYAQWQINSYAVDFDSQGGSAVSSQAVNWNQKATKPSDPTRTGYDFVGWYTDSSCTDGNEFDFSTQIKEAKILYAKWKVQTLKITFNKNANDATGSMSGLEFTYEDLPKTLTANAYDRTANGYYFNFWNSKADKTGYYFYDTYEVNAANWDWVRQYAGGTVNLTLYAQWEIIQYQVYFDTRDGIWEDSAELQSQWVNWHTQATKPSNPTKAGYTFAGWFMLTDGGTTLSSSEFDFSSAITDNTTLYAKWDELALTITFNANGGTGTMTAQTVRGDDLAAGPTLTPNTAISREGYNFLGWSKSALATSADFADGEVISDSVWNALYSSTGATLYAVWKIQTFTVKFVDALTGSMLSSQTVEWKAKATRPSSNPSKTGYEFLGWDSLNGTSGALESAFDFDTQITADTTIYAKWEAETLTITFNANGGTGATVTQTISYDQLQPSVPLTANAFSKEGYNFTGWATSSTGARKYADRETISTSNWASVRTSETITLYAVWEIKKFTVTFIDALDSTTLSSQTVEYNGTITTPSNPTKTHYTFLAWDDTNLIPTAMESAANLSTPVTADRSIWAKWTPDTYTVTFDGNGATSGSMLPMVFAYGVSQTLTASAFEKSGYLFGGWALSSTAATTAFGDEAVLNAESDMTLYAMWTSRGSVSRENGLVAQLDEENEQIIFSAGGIYTSYTWMIDGVSYGSGESITVPYNSSYANGSNHFVLLIGVDADGESNAESANFKILPKN